MAYIHNKKEVIVNENCSMEKAKELFKQFGYSCAEDMLVKDKPLKEPKYPILEEVEKILSGDRRSDYGKASASFKRIADYWNAYLCHKRDKIDEAAHEEDLPYEFLRGEYLTDYDVAMLMILFKIAREENKHKRDNITDIIGYAVLAEDLANIHTDVEE